MGKLAWRISVWLWVAAPVIGLWPNVAPKVSQLGWWLIASCLVIAVGMTQRQIRSNITVFGWLLIAVLVVFASHVNSIGSTLLWLYQSSMILVSAFLIAERAEIKWIKEAFLAIAFFQIFVMWVQSNWLFDVWPSSPEGLPGTLGKRAACSIFLGAVSFFSRGWLSWLFAIASCATGSFAGSVPAMARLLWPWVLGRGRMIGLMIAIGSFIVSFPLWGYRFASRIEAWKGLEFLKQGWFTGWGFLPFPGGFQDESTVGMRHLWREYHSSLFDWVGRTGLIGYILLMALLIWALKRSIIGGAWYIWAFIFALWVGFWQSAEAFPVMIMLWLVWLVVLSIDKRGETCPG